jgi:hypothetical protein
MKIYLHIRIFPSHPSVRIFPSHTSVRILPFHPSTFYPPIRPHFTLSSVSILPSHPSVRPHPRFTLTRYNYIIAACWKLNIATYAVNFTEKPFFVTSIAILALLLIHNEIYNKWQQSSKIQEQKCAGFSLLTVNKNGSSSIVQVLAHAQKICNGCPQKQELVKLWNLAPELPLRNCLYYRSWDEGRKYA